LCAMRVYIRALSYFKSDWPLVGVLLLLIGVSTAVGILMAWPMAILIDSVLGTTGKDDWAHRFFLGMVPANRTGQIIGLGVAGLILKLLQDLSSLAQTVVSNHVNYNGLMRVRCDLYRKLQSLNLSYHKSQPQGDAIYRVSSDTFGFQTILQVLIAAMVACMTLAVMTCVLMTRSVSLTLAALSIAPPLALLNVIFGRRLKSRSLECKEQDAHFTTVVQRSMACIGLVQAFGREQDEFGHFRQRVQGTIAAWWRLNRQQMLYNLLIGTTFGLGGAVVFIYGGYLVYRDQVLQPVVNGLSVGDLVIFTSYLGMLWAPLCSLTGFVSNVQGGVAGGGTGVRSDGSCADRGGRARCQAAAAAASGVEIGGRHVRVRGGFAGVAGRFGDDSSGGDGGVRRVERGREEHAAQLVAPVLRPAGGGDHAGRWRR
jgi:ATP-binding cassette, subfamily B, bacterial